MNYKSTVLWLAVIILVIGGLYYWMRPGAPAPSQTMEISSVPVGPNIIEITANGYSRGEIRIKKGETVTWINKDSAPHWPATAAHPTHKVYPGSDIAKCGTAEQASIFDACKGLAQGESYSFQFDQAGTWKYHDHLKPVAPFFGSVIVE